MKQPSPKGAGESLARLLATHHDPPRARRADLQEVAPARPVTHGPVTLQAAHADGLRLSLSVAMQDDRQPITNAVAVKTGVDGEGLRGGEALGHPVATAGAIPQLTAPGLAAAGDQGCRERETEAGLFGEATRPRSG